jgi:hypothetical protein
MNNLIMAIQGLPPLSDFTSNPIETIVSVLTTPFGVFGYIFVLFALIAIVYSYTKNVESIGIFIVLYGILADVFYPPAIAILINFLGLGLIFGGVIYKALFKERGDY